MAYNLKYTANFTNEQNQLVEVKLYQDGGTGTVENYAVTSLRISANSEEQELYSCIISKEIELGIWCEDSDSITWESFITSSFTEWKIIVTVDSINFFTGYLTPEESQGPLQDKPYEIILRGTDGLGLLKGYELKKTDGTNFNSTHFLKDYIAGALKKTGLDLDIKIYSCLLWNSNINKSTGLQYDMFNQNLLNWRTFLKDSTTFESCYDTLLILLNGWCSIEQVNGAWQIMLLSERQYVPDVWYWVKYNSLGSVVTSGYDSTIQTSVGKVHDIYPINETQIISSRIPYKQTKTIYNYSQPVELIINSSQQFLGGIISGLSGTYNTAYYLLYWSRWQNAIYSKSAYSGAPDYINVELDEFGTQKDRYFALEGDLSTFKFIQNDNNDFWVDANDKFDISITMRMKLNVSLGSELLSSSGWSSTNWTGNWSSGFSHTTGNISALTNSLAATSGYYYKIAITVVSRSAGYFTVDFGGFKNENLFTTTTYEMKASSTGSLAIVPTSNFDGTIGISIKRITISSGLCLRPILSIQKDFSPGNSTFDYYTLNSSGEFINDGDEYFAFLNPATDDVTQWKTISLTDVKVPVSGVVKLNLYAWNVDAQNLAHYKDIKITYKPEVRGSYNEVIGDYHLNAQTTNFADKLDQEVKISDSPKRILKGAMFGRISGNDYLIVNSWRRYPNVETLNFKQAVNYGRYNQAYRRFYRIEGDFTGINNLSFHKQYYFTDLPYPRAFVLIPSLEMDLMTGNFKAVFVEVVKDENDGTQTGTTDEFSYIFK